MQSAYETYFDIVQPGARGWRGYRATRWPLARSRCAVGIARAAIAPRGVARTSAERTKLCVWAQRASAGAMYNGIGLTTVRGSGTNGYVQRNLAHVSQTRVSQMKAQQSDFSGEPSAPRMPNKEIIHHNRKREVELRLLQLRETLEDEGLDEEEIDAKVDEKRQAMLKKIGAAPPSGGAAAARTGETHADAALKVAENAALKDALGIGSEYVGGSAFNRELQEQKREARAEARAAEEAERAELMAVLEREKEREERKRAKEERRAEKEARKRHRAAR